MRATLDHVLNEGAFVRTVTLAERFAAGVQATIDELELPWIVARLGCRAEYWPCPVAPRNGAEAAAAEDPELDRFLHLFALNRGVLMTPFHNMALIAPATTEADVDRHTQVFREAAGALVG
jgi:glutamate-1-semialdehyde 2,1-aminomutase